MREKLEEARDILHAICCDIEGRYPIGCVRAARLLEEVLAGWWDDDERVALAEEEEEAVLAEEELDAIIVEEPHSPAA